MHQPVLLKEVLKYLNLRQGKIIVDATLGCGGHAELILNEILPQGLLIGIDQDEEALVEAKKKLNKFDKETYKIIKGNFRNIDSVLNQLDINKIDGILFDLGLSQLQLEHAYRGFSINLEGPLDMRMDRSSKLTAFDVVNNYSENKLADIIKRYGEERYAGKIAKTIVEKRKPSSIKTTRELSVLINNAIGFRYRHLKIHPATRTFQAVRIEVNQELAMLSFALEKLPLYLNHNARVCVISFHSLEDRIVKNSFKEYARENKFSLINKKPIIATPEEVKVNPRSRSAKMRVAEFK